MFTLFSSGSLLVRRRVRRDLALVLCWTALLAFVVVLGAAAPRVIVSSVDDGARQAVSDAGSNADLIVHTAIGSSNGGGPSVSPTDILAFTSTLRTHLPRGLAATFSTATLSVTSPSTTITNVDGVAPANTLLNLEMGMLTPQQTATIHLVQGAFPTASDDTATSIGVVVSAAVAQAANVKVGGVLALPRPESRFGAAQSGVGNQLVVVGIVDQTDTSAKANVLWTWLPQVWKPRVSYLDNGTKNVEVTVLASPDGVAKSSGFFAQPINSFVRVQLKPEAFSRSLVDEVSKEFLALAANSNSLSPQFGAALGSGGTFADALATYPTLAQAAIAQMSLMIAGLLGVAGTVVLLLSRLIILRRSDELALERARGASIASIGMRAFEESLATAVVGGVFGIGILALVLPDALRDPVILSLVLLVALFAPAVQSMLVARSLWSRSRVPANRVARAEIASRARLRRVVIEAALFVLAGAALFSIRTRGLLETRTDGIDPLLAVAPLLLAAAITILVLRIYPFILRGVALLARRSRGAMGVLASMQAERALAVLPLLALTLAVALAASGGLVIETVRTGELEASWQRVGADVRVSTSDDVPLTANDVTAVASRTGVTAVASARISTQVSISSARSSASVGLVAIDRNYAQLVALIPTASGGGARSAATLRGVATSTSASEPLPVVVDKGFDQQITAKDVLLSVDNKNVPARVVGTVDVGPDGYTSGPFVFVDLAALSARIGEPVQPNTLLITGPGAGAAASALSVPKSDIHTRTAWLATQQHGPLISGVIEVMTISVAGVVALAIVALVSTVLSGARTRARSLALLRTLGMRSRLGWWLALTELAPIVVAAVIGGLTAGIGIVLFVAPVIGLKLLTGGLHPPVPAVSATVVLVIVGTAILLLILATAVEVLAHRRDNLSEMLRIGDTR
ncbi:MAG: FtsX-like permease family protein [Rhodoglobus sp.]